MHYRNNITHLITSFVRYSEDRHIFKTSGSKVDDAIYSQSKSKIVTVKAATLASGFSICSHLEKLKLVTKNFLAVYKKGN